jgi:hypothetical protein
VGCRGPVIAAMNIELCDELVSCCARIRECFAVKYSELSVTHVTSGKSWDTVRELDDVQSSRYHRVAVWLRETLRRRGYGQRSAGREHKAESSLPRSDCMSGATVHGLWTDRCDRCHTSSARYRHVADNVQNWWRSMTQAGAIGAILYEMLSGKRGCVEERFSLEQIAHRSA